MPISPYGPRVQLPKSARNSKMRGLRITCEIGRSMFKNAAEIFAYIKKEDVKLVDVRFTDLPGIQHHFNVPVESFDEAVFTDGLMSVSYTHLTLPTKRIV